MQAQANEREYKVLSTDMFVISVCKTPCSHGRYACIDSSSSAVKLLNLWLERLEVYFNQFPHCVHLVSECQRRLAVISLENARIYHYSLLIHAA